MVCYEVTSLDLPPLESMGSRNRASENEALSPTTSRIFRLRHYPSTPVFSLRVDSPSPAHTRHLSHRLSGSSEIMDLINENQDQTVTGRHNRNASGTHGIPAFRGHARIPSIVNSNMPSNAPRGFGATGFGPIGGERAAGSITSSRLAPPGFTAAQKSKSLSEAEMTEAMQPDEVDALRESLKSKPPQSLQEVRDRKVEDKQKRKDLVSFLRVRTNSRAAEMGVPAIEHAPHQDMGENRG